MDTKGANTFPLYNVPPEPKNLNSRSFLFFSTFPYWIKEKSVATLAIRDIAIKSKTQSQFTVSQNWRLCWGILKREVTLKIRSLMFSNCFFV